jgi:hypothetical protein
MRLGDLSSLLLVPTQEGKFQVASKIYFNECRQLFSFISSQINIEYVQDFYLKSKEENEKDSWIDFLTLLGVSKAPKLVKVENEKITLEMSLEFNLLFEKGNCIQFLFFKININTK